MFNREIEALLSLTAFSIFADKRVFANEIDSFVKSADQIQAVGRSTLAITESKLLYWFEMNREQLQDKMKLGPAGLKRWLLMIMDDLAAFPDKGLIVSLIKKISKSDGEYHISEKALCVLVEEKLDLSA